MTCAQDGEFLSTTQKTVGLITSIYIFPRKDATLRRKIRPFNLGVLAALRDPIANILNWLRALTRLIWK
jgi:hypothetical protein